MSRPPRQPDWHRDWSRTGPRADFRTGPGASGPGPGAGERGAGVFAFARAWAAGIVVLIATEYLQVTLVYQTFVGPGGTRSFASALLLVHLPNLVCVALATWAAARLHPEPYREAPARHAVAACAVPVCGQLLALSMQWDRPGSDALGLWLSNAALLAGCTVGWAADRWQRSAA
ncbi:hypothetical protein GCM10018793_25420 [Streptomyces sulfonofaciens]|uniref:Uncharacterized protein n=1 Tax=Streptomyces sulfonofaciens TaxID=68272 RepID=A0A919KZI4_9ACTN|nr:hypothetical protein [Streptomyces sulfonofaciens]GHH77411.1 hypothetical protein GCM10018793_25420 [Streptomyces sulfonofaciens]